MSWLPRGFEFLPGLPEDKRRRRNLVVIQAFADDSGVYDGKSTILAIAAFVGPAEHWAEFSDEWAHYLRQSPAIPYFKMKEAAGLGGQFRGWNESDRDEKIRGLVRIIDRHPRLVCWQSCEIKAERFLKENAEFLPTAYYSCFSRLIHDVCLTLWDHNIREPFEMTFDEQVIHGIRAKEWYPASKLVTKAINPDAYSILPADIGFRKDEDYLPLQAADLWAWCVRDANQLGLPPERNSEHKFGWILKELSKLRMSKYSRHMTEEHYVASWKEAQGILSRELSPEREMHREAYANAKPKPKRKKKPQRFKGKR
jgi:hypothetical protein